MWGAGYSYGIVFALQERKFRVQIAFDHFHSARDAAMSSTQLMISFLLFSLILRIFDDFLTSCSDISYYIYSDLNILTLNFCNNHKNHILT